MLRRLKNKVDKQRDNYCIVCRNLHVTRSVSVRASRSRSIGDASSNVNQPQLTDPALDTSVVALKIYHILRERLRLIIACTVFSMAIGIGYILWTPSLYDATTTVQVNQTVGNLMQTKDLQTQDLTEKDSVSTIAQNLASLSVMRRVVNRLHLTPESLYLPQKPPLWKKMFVSYDHYEYSLDALAGYLWSFVTVAPQRDTRLILVTGESRDPKLAKDISDAVVAEYMAQRVEAQSDLSSGAVSVLKTQAEQLSAKLNKSEQALQDYKEKYQAVSLGADQNITVAELNELNAKVTEAKSERLKLEADYLLVQRFGNDPEKLITLKAVSNSPDVLEQKKRVAEQGAELARMRERSGPRLGEYKAAEGRLNEVKGGLARTVLEVAATIATGYESALETEQKFKQALAEQEKRALALTQISIPYNALQRQMVSDKTLYDLVLKRMNEADTARESVADEIRLVDPAVVPSEPAKPLVKLVIALSVLGGLGVGIGLSFLLGLIDTSFKTIDEAEAELGLRAVGAIPKARRADRGCSIPVIVGKPEGDIAEAFRTLRTELSFVNGPHREASLLFASAAPAEGKSFCAINYAMSLVQQGDRVLLIDGDLRMPSIGEMFHIESKALGMTDYVSGRAGLSDAIHPTKFANFSVLPAGQQVRNPTQLLADPRVGEMIRQAEKKFDRVVIDSAPIHAVSDSLLLAKHIPCVCLVIRAGKTPRREVLRALHKLSEADSQAVGFILNRLPLRGNYYYQYGGQKYGAGAYTAVKRAA